MNNLTRPALLASYYYLDGWLNAKPRMKYRDWCLDSGAYSAWSKGESIDLAAYTAMAKVLQQRDPSLVEVVALDVIGDARASLENAWMMKECGVNVIPVHHIDDDWGILTEYCQNWEKVGISCRLGEPLRKSYWYYDQCFARVWPHKLHSFGWAGEEVLNRYPFHSADSTTWELRPTKFGKYKSLGNAALNVKGSYQNLAGEVKWWMEFERGLREKWATEMRMIEPSSPERYPVVRLVVGSGRSVRGEGIQAINGG